MPDRIIRDELLDSERYLSLSSDTSRMAFLHLVLNADDLGNTEASGFYMRRKVLMSNASDEAVAKILSELADADLIRVYEVGGKRYVHIPRFRQRLRYLNGKHPRPPQNIECNEINGLVNQKSDSSQAQARLKSDSSQTQVSRSEEKRSEEKRREEENTRESKPRSSSSVVFKTFLDQCKARDEKFIPAEDSIFEYARSIGLDTELLQLHYQAFKTKYLNDTKRYTDWRATFRNSVRGNWFKVWFFNADGKPVSTTHARQIAAEVGA